MQHPKEVKSGSYLPGTSLLVTGRTAAESLATRLVHATYRYPMIFRKALDLSKRDNVSGDMTAGMADLNLQYFPDIKFWDSARNPGVVWDGKKVLHVIHPDAAAGKHTLLVLAERVTQEVKTQLHASNLVYKSTVDKMTHITVLPWMEEVSYQTALSSPLLS